MVIMLQTPFYFTRDAEDRINLSNKNLRYTTIVSTTQKLLIACTFVLQYNQNISTLRTNSVCVRYSLSLL